MDVLACVSQVKHISAEINPDKFTLKQVEGNIIRCPDKATAKKMIRLIERVRKQGDSVGGIHYRRGARCAGGLGRAGV